MTTLYLGPRNSGKSLAAEARCSRTWQRTSYLATLPELPEFERRIHVHAARRPASRWCTRYLALPAPNLLEELALASAESPCVLLDGFSAILKVQYCFFGGSEASMASLTDDILAIIDRSAAACDWVVVDNELAVGDGSLPAVLRDGIVRAQARLVAGAESIERFSGGNMGDLQCPKR